MAKDKSTARPQKIIPHNPYREGRNGKNKRLRKMMRDKKRGGI